MYTAIIRKKFLSEESKRSIDAIKTNLQHKKKTHIPLLRFLAASFELRVHRLRTDRHAAQPDRCSLPNRAICELRVLGTEFFGPSGGGCLANPAARFPT